MASRRAPARGEAKASQAEMRFALGASRRKTNGQEKK